MKQALNGRSFPIEEHDCVHITEDNGRTETYHRNSPGQVSGIGVSIAIVTV